jgi:hypothetical protein
MFTRTDKEQSAKYAAASNSGTSLYFGGMAITGAAVGWGLSPSEEVVVAQSGEQFGADVVGAAKDRIRSVTRYFCELAANGDTVLASAIPC